MLRPQSWGTLLMLDVEKLRDVNDAYGHRAGDAVLKRISRAIRASIRGDDVAARWIGDNFTILAPGFYASQAEVLAKRPVTALQPERVSMRWGTPESPRGALTAPALLRPPLQ